MAKVKVAVNGYGTIGKRVADAVKLQPDMELIGVAKQALITRHLLQSKRVIGYSL